MFLPPSMMAQGIIIPVNIAAIVDPIEHLHCRYITMPAETADDAKVNGCFYKLGTLGKQLGI